MNLPEELKYTESHEWVKIQGNVAIVGITDHAQSELGDIVYVDLPKVGADTKADAVFGTIEAVKTVADLYSPLSGKVTEVNTALADEAEVINSDPYGKGWIIKIQFGNIDGKLLSAAEYKAFIGH
jgi:glycine cleavage system H protein